MNSKRSSMLILMADDDEDDCLLVKNALEENVTGSELHFVSDGRELLEYLDTCCLEGGSNTQRCPNIILLDMNMPIKDGREALKEIKTDPRHKSIPVVVLTTSQADQDVQFCYQNGASSYMVKPNTYDELVGTMKCLAEYWFKRSTLPSKRCL